MSSICILAIQIEELHIFLICPHHHHHHPHLCKFRWIFFWTTISWMKLSLFCNSALITSLRWVPLTDNGYSDRWWTGKQAKCICSNYKIYLSKLQNVFIKIDKYICQNRNSILITTGSTDWQWMFWWTMDLHKHPNVFVWTSKCIYRNQQMYLSQFTNIYFKIATLSSSQHQKMDGGQNVFG